MYELLNVEIKDGKQLVSARDLYDFLEVGRDFTSWIRGRISKYDFIEQADYVVVSLAHQNGGASWGGQNKVDYAITLDMAKELAMVENNEKGKIARRYFIQCEKLTKQLTMYYDEKLAVITDRLDRTEKLIGIRRKTVFNYGRYIKNKMGIINANKEYENVKMVLFAELGVQRWEQIDYSLDVVLKIDEIMEVMGLSRQLSLIG